MNPEICIIAALSEKNRIIGKDGQIPWRIPADLKHFRELTVPHPIIMGRKTFQSIGRVLPKRLNIVVSRTISRIIGNPDLVTADTVEGAINLAKDYDRDRIFIMGGGEIYQQAMPLAERLFLTLVELPVEGDFEGDTFFPDYSAFGNVVSEEPGEENGIKFRFVELER